MKPVWFLLVGALLLFMGISGSLLRRLPVSTAMLYLLAGYALGPAVAGLLVFDALNNLPLLELITEVAVLISLFAVGLRLRAPWSAEIWQLSLRLGVVAMLITISLVAVLGVVALDLSWASAILLGAILAPTDPVLASDVQLKNAEDRDRVKSSLTGEGGLNDGIAFPFVMLGLGLMGLHDVGNYLTRWVTVDLLWAIFAGLGSGWVLGRAVSSLVIWLRGKYQEALGLEEFLTLGLIALAYGFALAIHAYGFLAVFAAGVAVRRLEGVVRGAAPPKPVIEAISAEDEQQLATHPATAPVYMIESVLRFSLQTERIAEMVVVLLLGSLLSANMFNLQLLLLVVLLFFVIRPISVMLALTGATVSSTQR